MGIAFRYIKAVKETKSAASDPTHNLHRHGTSFHRCRLHAGLSIPFNFFPVFIFHDFYLGLRLVCARNSPNRLRHDLLWSRQRNLFGYIWFAYEVPWTFLDHRVRNGRSHGNLQLLAFLATTS